MTALGSLVYAMSLKMLRKPEEAEELVQEVFLAVWRRAKDYDPKRGTPEAWLITMTRSRAIDRPSRVHAQQTIRK